MPETECPICQMRIEGNGDLSEEVTHHIQEHHPELKDDPYRLGEVLFATFLTMFTRSLRLGGQGN